MIYVWNVWMIFTSMLGWVSVYLSNPWKTAKDTPLKFATLVRMVTTKIRIYGWSQKLIQYFCRTSPTVSGKMSISPVHGLPTVYRIQIPIV
jgi:hypothetical protein